VTVVLNSTDLGIRLLLWIGPIVPLPAPPWFSQALQKAEVTCDADGNNGFQLTFALSRDTPVDYTGLISGTLDPFNRVIIGVLMGAVPEILIDGVITHQQFSPSDQPGKTTVTVTGLDVTAMMNLTQQTQGYYAMPDSIIVTLILAQYAQYGLVPVATPTTDVPVPLERTVWQRAETDLAFIKRLAQRNGYKFYVAPVTIGVNTAYFGLDVRLGVPQSALTVNMGAASNIISLSFTNDPLKATGVTGNLLLPLLGGITLPLPPVPLPFIPPLALLPTVPRRSEYLGDVASDDLPQAIGKLMDAMAAARDTVTGEGTLDAVRYGGVLKARAPVGVRGVGFSYDGFYYVKHVVHNIDVPGGKYTQSFSLAREGLGALLPVVVP
jgi:hypothetical protein